MNTPKKTAGWCISSDGLWHSRCQEALPFLGHCWFCSQVVLHWRKWH